MSELILNPLLSYRYFEKNDEILNIQTAAPKKKDSVWAQRLEGKGHEYANTIGNNN